MGYTTEFYGKFDFDAPLNITQKEALEEFANARHEPSESPDFPSYWCQWVPGEDAKSLVWDGGEKFYDYVEWLEYLIKTFIIPWGHNLNGEVMWSGEDQGDVGKILVVNNAVTVKFGNITFN